MHKTPLRCRKSAGHLAAMLRGDAERIAARLAPRMARVLEEGEAMPDVAHLIDVLSRMVLHESERIDEETKARERQGFWVQNARQELRETAVPELRAAVQEVRKQVRTLYGEKTARSWLDHSGRTPRGREELEDLAHHMLHHVPLMPATRIGDQEVDPAGLVKRLGPAYERFSELMSELDGRRDDEIDRVDATGAAIEMFDRTFSRVRTLGAMFYKLAGLERMVKYLERPGGRPQRRSTRPISGAA